MSIELESAGFVVRARAIDQAALVRLLDECELSQLATAVRHPTGAAYSARGLLWTRPILRDHLQSAGISDLIKRELGHSVFPIDANFFDKHSDANWSVPGHQDRLMPVEVGPLKPRAVRNGVAYAEPAAETLARLLAVRIHFDAASSDAGALQVIPGSHRNGVLADRDLRELSLDAFRSCPASRGDLLLMRPLLVHRSGRSDGAGHRRVLHVVYACEQPTDSFTWKSSAQHDCG